MCDVKGTTPVDNFVANDPNILGERFMRGNQAAIVVDLVRVRDEGAIVPHAYMSGILDDLDEKEARRVGRHPVVDVWASFPSSLVPGRVPTRPPLIHRSSNQRALSDDGTSIAAAAKSH